VDKSIDKLWSQVKN